MSPALLQADCALFALPPSCLPGLPATLAVLWYSGVVPAIVLIFAIVLVLIFAIVLVLIPVSCLPGFITYTCSSLVSLGVLVPAIILVPIPILTLSSLAYLRGLF